MVFIFTPWNQKKNKENMKQKKHRVIFTPAAAFENLQIENTLRRPLHQLYITPSVFFLQYVRLKISTFKKQP